MVQSNISHFIFAVPSFINHQKSVKVSDYISKVEKCNNQQTSITGTNQTWRILNVKSFNL